ncbi:MAG: hypothetical protein A2138_18135 [Deltaproteobacteria bacterium RBG_16_71_12]|nr:MAG: hypothetical protein A2138_18135 [Deltaproteobacteria bacterium RBG_16_71_12]
MASDELKSFKVGDKVKKPVEPPRPGAKAEPTPQAASVGFPRIEAVVEADEPDLSGLQARHAELSAMATGSKANKGKAAAKKAALAYQRAQELIVYLLETKAKMTAGPGPGASGS